MKSYTDRTRMETKDSTAQRSLPVTVYAIQCFDPQREADGNPYGGRYFRSPGEADIDRMIAAEREWNARREADLKDYWPRSVLPHTWMTHHLNGGIPNWGQVLGQLAERISYDQLYQDAVRDPTLKRTKQELEVAISNADLARNVVFELFQDLDSFNVDEYRKFDDGGVGMNRLLAFVRDWASIAGASLHEVGSGVLEAISSGNERHRFTTNRERAKHDDDLGLLGLEHPLVRQVLGRSRDLLAADRALLGRSSRFPSSPIAISIWHVEVHGTNGYFRQAVSPLAIDAGGKRVSFTDSALNQLREVEPALSGIMNVETRNRLVNNILPEMLRRDVEHKGLLREDSSLVSRLIAWIELV